MVTYSKTQFDMKTQFKISYFTATGLKGSFLEFHTSERFDTYIQGGYMKDVTEVKVEATGFTTENRENAQFDCVAAILNQLGGGATAKYTQDQLDALAITEIGHDGTIYDVTSVDGQVACKDSGRFYYVPFVSKTFYPN